MRRAHGVYVPVDSWVDPTDAHIAVVAERLTGGAVIGGWAAARLHEAGARAGSDLLTVFDGRLPTLGSAAAGGLPVLVCAPRAARLHPTPGSRVFRSEVEPDEITHLSGVAVTSAARTAFDLARLWPTPGAVVALDRLLHLRLVDASELAGLLTRRIRWRGVGAGRRALALADGRAESPRETALRLVWTQTGLPRPMANAVVMDHRGAFVARVDLVDAAAGIVGEYDGAFHASAQRRSRDAVRHEALEQLGMTVIRAAEPDLATAAARRTWQDRLRRAYALARVRSGPRGWRVVGDPQAGRSGSAISA